MKGVILIWVQKLTRLPLMGSFFCWLIKNGMKVVRVKRAYCCRHNYAKVLKRIKSNPVGYKIKVLFIVSEPAKWKCQKLYEEFQRDGHFEPIVGLSAWNVQSTLNDEELDVHLNEAEKFFDQLGDAHVRTVTTHPRVTKDLSEFAPDIVIYNEQWRPCWNQWPEPVSRFALTFFIPYYVPDYADENIDCLQKVEQYSYVYFTLNEAWSNLYGKYFKKRSSVAKLVACGHPALDFFNGVLDAPVPPNGFIIYAPHFAINRNGDMCDWPIKQGTFDWNGKLILEYAKSHPEFRWVFKPHPLLKYHFVRCGYMTQTEVDEYFSNWEEFAICCYRGDYQKLFLESRAMITDCGSFLAEYGATGRPLIHLWCNANTTLPPLPSQELWDGYYRVANREEMFDAFRLVIECGKDPKREYRLRTVRKLRLEGGASRRIVSYIKCLIGR